MTEDELLTGLTDALTLAGWTWTHIRRSDGITMGNAGLPDIIAVKAGHPMLLWELKSQHGSITPDQMGWLLAAQDVRVQTAIVRPDGYDAALAVILG